MNEYNNSLKIYENLFKNDNRDSITIIIIAELNRMFCKYDEAKEYYSFYKEKYISNQGDKLKFDKAIESKVNYPKINRSEEHTSELQSRPHLVCRLLLEKKKKQQ